MITLLLNGVLVYLLQPPLLYHVYSIRFLAFSSGCFGCLTSRLSDQASAALEPDEKPPRRCG